MGMFDYIECKIPLLDAPSEFITKNTLFQTKDTPEQGMETYTITKEGRLIHHAVKYEDVPENERPYWGTPEWDNFPPLRFCGCIRSVPIGDIDTNFHGDLRFGESFRNPYSDGPMYLNYDWVARFTNGQLEYIKRI
jgi:hypothetical protein